ncbi:hypothetical protein [Streptomyces sp. NBC_01353]|uniref:hypothetical protein n=1 Tax=Streptomyces sp. NBC_01353 TaxID=2903835 RepID=UPI003DA58EA9
MQLSLAADLVAHALEALSAEGAEPEELRRLTADLTDALKEALRGATSRGHSLSAADVGTRDGNEGPRLLAAAFG